jgi:hypothetical protein
VLPTKATANQAFEPSSRTGYQLDWDPKSRAAWHIPVLAEDCPRFAFLGVAAAHDQPLLWLGSLEHPSQPTPLPTTYDSHAQGRSSVAIARSCRMAVVRDQWNANEKQNTTDAKGELLFVKLNADGRPSAEPVHKLALDSEEANFQPSPFPQMQSPLVAAQRADGSWRVAWLSERGVEVVDADLTQDKLTFPYHAVDERGRDRPRQLLSGLDPAASMTRLSLSTNGDFLFIAQQRNFSAPPDVRVFDLRDARTNVMRESDAVKRACAIATFLPPGNQLSKGERQLWLGDKDAAQPCAAP